MTRFEQTWESASRIEGWLTEGQGRILHEAASEIRAGETAVEVGSHHGRSTVVISSALPEGVEMVAVDPFDEARWGGGQDAEGIFRANLAERGLSERVRLVRTYGSQAGLAWQGKPVAMLFLDGAHDFSAVDADLRAWLPHLSPTAIVLMHDSYSAPGVTRAAFRHMFGSRQFAYVGSSRTLAMFRRQRMSAGAWTASNARMLGRLVFFARNLAIKAAHRREWTTVPRLLGHPENYSPF